MIRFLLALIGFVVVRWTHFLQLAVAAYESYRLPRRLGAFGEGSQANGRVDVVCPENVFVGSNVHIGLNTMLRAEAKIFIGDNTHMGRDVAIWTANHNFEGERLPYDDKVVKESVVIGKNVWIGAFVRIAPGVAIGDGAIIGLGAVVTSDVPPLAIVGNQPLRVLKHRDRERYERLEAAGLYGGRRGCPLSPPKQRKSQ